MYSKALDLLVLNSVQATENTPPPMSECYDYVII